MCQYYTCRTEIISKKNRQNKMTNIVHWDVPLICRSVKIKQQRNKLRRRLIILRFDVINFDSCYIFEMRKYLLIDRTSKTRLIEISPSRFRARLGFGSIQIQALLWLGFSSWSFASFVCVAYLLRKTNHVYFHNTTH